ncbi:hypothetical protein [Gordonia sp. (in: high G+C Gram-positive bacteria)]|uniref:YncE family protein n=1 Tax=Gordonia sp. (in: high G+C Gram-positive bacteria) TaxID=84139 RepID=UPI0016BAC3E1|nr:hypothetical protein [Gordonia sp. (in: high G+C Gram-positive bacteria)]NLG47048.1 hypothetical protein [Gordonia sp. (in: high G+C Gram-positive bacteria)]
MRARTRITALLVAVATASALTACGQSEDGPKENVPTVTPATAAQSPTGGPAPTGTVIGAVPARTVVAGRGDGAKTALLASDGKSIQLIVAPGAMDTPPPITVRVPDLGALTAAGAGFVGAGRDGLVRIDAQGAVTEQQVDLGGVLSVAVTGDDRVLVGNDRGRLLVLDADGKIERNIGGFVRVDDITVAPASAGERAGQVMVLDQAQSAVVPVDIDTGELKAALRAGDGATQAVVDEYGRVLVSGTRTDEVFAFYGQPIMMRMRAPVPSSPYALAFDNQRKLLWVSSTAENIVTAYDVATGEAKERHRVASLPQVTSMDVDAAGTLLIASGRDASLQVVFPNTLP